jgi:hypothetical protein
MKEPARRDGTPTTRAPRHQSGVTEFFTELGAVTLGNMPEISFAGRSAWTFEIWVYLDALVDAMFLISRAGEFLMATEGARVTVMAWFMPAAIEGRHAIVSNGPLGRAGMSVTLSASRQVQFQVGAAAPIASTAKVQPHEWTNVACSWNASTGASTIYINGDRDTAGTMTFAAPLAAGAPLIGAADDPGTALPSANFIGHIQSASVWSRILTLDEIRQFHTADPLNDSKCTADYDFVLPRAQNSASLNPVGLAGTNALTVIASVHPGPRGSMRVHGNAPPVAPAVATHVTAADFGRGARERMVSDFRSFMTEDLGLTPEQQEPYAARMRENLARVEQELRDGTHRTPFEIFVERVDDHTHRLILVSGGERVIAYEGELDECTLWAIGFLVQIASTIYAVFGFTVNLSLVRQGLTNYLGQRINTIGLVPQVRAVFSGGVSPAAVYKALKVLHEYGLVTGMGKFLWQAVTQTISYWTIFSLSMRIVLLFSPYAPLEIALFTAELAMSLVGVRTAWNDKPPGCWSSRLDVPLSAGQP